MSVTSGILHFFDNTGFLLAGNARCVLSGGHFSANLIKTKKVYKEHLSQYCGLTVVLCSGRCFDSMKYKVAVKGIAV